jgi:hypothetical protein
MSLKKLIGMFAPGMLQLIEFESFPFDQVIPCARKARLGQVLFKSDRS